MIKRDDDNCKLKSQGFKSYKDAKQFAKEHRGYVEGAFYDEQCNTSYIVFYKEGRVVNSTDEESD